MDWIFLKEAGTYKAARRFIVSVNDAESYAPRVHVNIVSDHLPGGLFAVDAADQIRKLAEEQRKLAGNFARGVIQSAGKHNIQARQGPFTTRLEIPGGRLVVNTSLLMDLKIKDGSQTSEYWEALETWANAFFAEFTLRK